MEQQSTGGDQSSTSSYEMPFIELASQWRKVIKSIGSDVLAMKKHSDFFPSSKSEGDKAEMVANVMLAYRHLEDAAMRLGKAIQAKDGGASIYDK